MSWWHVPKKVSPLEFGACMPSQGTHQRVACSRLPALPGGGAGEGPSLPWGPPAVALARFRGRGLCLGDSEVTEMGPGLPAAGALMEPTDPEVGEGMMEGVAAWGRGRAH